MAASGSWPALGEMTRKSKKVVTESGKDSPEKSPPSGGETELATALGSKDQPPEKNVGSSEGTETDQQKGKKKGDGRDFSVAPVDVK